MSNIKTHQNVIEDDWLEYESEVSSENIRERLIRSMKLLKQDQDRFIKNCVTIKGI